MTNLRKEPEPIDRGLTTWKGSRLRQHREYLALPFRRKMELLEEMTQRFPKVRAKNESSTGTKSCSLGSR